MQDQAGDPQRRSKLLAEKRLPRGTSDVQGLSAINMQQMFDAGVDDRDRLLQVEERRQPAAVDEVQLRRRSHLLGQGRRLNPKIVTAAPKSYKDVFDPKHGNKLALIDIQYQYTLASAALAASGKITDIEGGKKLLLECKKAGMRIYPTNEAFAQGLKAEEFGIGVMWKARVVQWQNAGIPVESFAPTEGVISYVSGFAIPKNAPNKDGAYAYLDAMLEKGAQENFAIDMGYNPTVANAVVAPDLNQRIGFTPDEIKKLIDLDYDYMNKNDVALKEWWDKELKS